jgi:hypothetical protein
MKTRTRPTKAAAIRHARANVSELYKFGNGYRYRYYDATVNAWRESTPAPIHMALAHRSQGLINQACAHLGHETPPHYDGGTWTSYVRA